MVRIEITKTELVWPGKYNEDGSRKEAPRVRGLPFQVIERVAYRTRRHRRLPLVLDEHTYEQSGSYERPGSYRVLVKVIDIFGNDTSQAVEVEVE